jgi:hypothetical protein
MEAKFWKCIILRRAFNLRVVLTFFFLLVGTGFAVDNDGWSKFLPDRSESVISIETDTSGSVLWVGTIDGLYRKEGADIKTHGSSVDLSTEVVEDISVDIWNRPWCIVDGQVYIFTTYQTPEEEIVSTWYPCSFGELDSLQEVHATCMAQGPLDIVIGTNSGLIYSKNITRVKDTSLTGLGLPTRVLPEGNTIYDIVHWKGSYYFLSTSKGLFRLFNGRIKGVQRIGNVSVIQCAAIQSDTASKIWFADTGYVGQIDTSRRVSIENIIPLANVHSMCFDSIGHLWCATDSTLFEVYPQELVFVQHQLPKNPRIVIGPLLALSKDSILSGTDKGLFLFNPPRPIVTVKIKGVEEVEDGVLVEFKIRDFSSYPYLNFKWSIDGSDYSEWLTIEAKTSHTLNIGTLEDGEHELRIIIRPPLNGIDSTVDSYVFETGKPPFNWGLIVAIVILVGAVGIIIIVGILTRKRKVKTKKLRDKKSHIRGNPYRYGPPIRDSKYFVGRQKILRKTLSLIHNNCVLLRGDARIGKTSLLYQIRNRILAAKKDDEYKMIPIMIDLEKFEFEVKGRRKPKRRSAKTFYTNLVHVMAKAIYSKKHAANFIENPYTFSEFEDFMESVITRLKRNNRNKEIRVILLMDEGDEMTVYGLDFHKQFRGVFQSSYAKNFNIVLALREFTLEWRHRTSPWYNFFAIKELGPLNRVETYTLVKRYVRGGVEYKKDALKAIWNLTQGYPYDVQKLCSQIYDSLGNRVYVNRRDVLVASKELMEQDGKSV